MKAGSLFSSCIVEIIRTTVSILAAYASTINNLFYIKNIAFEFSRTEFQQLSAQYLVL